jgi:hypothetical protein
VPAARWVRIEAHLDEELQRLSTLLRQMLKTKTVTAGWRIVFCIAASEK